MSLHSERHIDTDRAGDTKGGGNYATLMDYLNRRKVIVAPFSENELVVATAQFSLLNSSQFPGTLAIGVNSEESDGGYMAASLTGAVGSAATTAIQDDNGSLINLVEVRDASTHDQILDGSNRKVYGLLQSDVGASDGDAVGAISSENCQISFVVIDSDGTLVLTSVNATIEIALAKMYAERHLPELYKEGSLAEADVIAPSASVPEPIIRKYIVTNDFVANEVITVSTGAGATAGTATPTGDTVDSLGASESVFNNDNRTRIRVNGAQCTKGTEAVWDSATTFHFSVPLDVGDSFEVEVAV